MRFPIQYVIRPQSHTVIDYRGYAGQVASGVLKPGDPVLVLPSGLETKIESIETADGPVDEAYPPMSVTVTLKDHLDISRGDMLCRPHNIPTVAQEIDAQVCWMDESAPMTKGGKYAIKHTTRWARALVRDIAYRIDVNTLHRDESADSLSLNEIGRVQLRVDAAAVRRHLPGEPPDRLVHPRRRALEQDGRRGRHRAGHHRRLSFAGHQRTAQASTSTLYSGVASAAT